MTGVSHMASASLLHWERNDEENYTWITPGEIGKYADTQVERRFFRPLFNENSKEGIELKEGNYPQLNGNIFFNHDGTMVLYDQPLVAVVGTVVGAVVTWVTPVVGIVVDIVVTTGVPGVVGMTLLPGESRLETVVIAFVFTSKFAFISS